MRVDGETAAPEEMHHGSFRALLHDMMNHLDQKDRAEDHDERGDGGDEIAAEELAEPRDPATQWSAPELRVHHQEARQAVRREQDDRDEEDAEVKNPEFLGKIRELDRKQCNDDRAKDRPDEEGDAAHIGGEQHRTRLRRADEARLREFDIDRRERTGDPREESPSANAIKRTNCGL